MKKERKPLTKREKVLIGVGVVGACVAGYFGYKYVKDLKIIKDQKNTIDDLIKDLMTRDTEAEIAKKIALEAMDAANNQEVINDITKDELSFLKYLIVEGDIVPKAIQNGANKIARKESKIKGIVEAISKHPNDESLMHALKQHEHEYKFMIHQQELAEQLKIAIENDECIYAK